MRIWSFAGIVVFSASFFMAASAFAAAPIISGFTPASASGGTVITVTGANFAQKKTQNIVYFGAVRAKVISAARAKLKVSVPISASYAPITVTVNGLTAYSQTPFEPTFLGGSDLTATNFAPPVNLATPNGPHHAVIADLDGDGKPDLAIVDIYDARISLFRNVSVAGVINSNSFAARVDLPSLYNSPANDNLWGITAADLNGDGKLDLVLCDRVSNLVWVYQNTSTAGSLDTNSFAPPVAFPTGILPMYPRVADLDGDGRPDIIVANYNSGTISILQNIGTPGPITTNSFAPEFELPVGAGPMEIAVGDLDGDGKPDIAVANHDSFSLSVIQNLSSAGTLDANSFAPGFTLPTLATPISLVMGDMNNDGKMDLVASSFDDSAVSVYENAANAGSLSAASFGPRIDFPTASGVHAMALGDLNGDSKLDIVVASYSEVSYFQNTVTAGNFTNNSLNRIDYLPGQNMWAASICDLDGDGRPDFLFTSGYAQMVSICQNLTPSPTASLTQLAALVQADVPNPKSLEALLSTAAHALNKGQPSVGVEQLQAFQTLVHKRLDRQNPDLANSLANDAQAIIDLLNG